MPVVLRLVHVGRNPVRVNDEVNAGVELEREVS